MVIERRMALEHSGQPDKDDALPFEWQTLDPFHDVDRHRFIPQSQGRTDGTGSLAGQQMDGCPAL